MTTRSPFTHSIKPTYPTLEPPFNCPLKAKAKPSHHPLAFPFPFPTSTLAYPFPFPTITSLSHQHFILAPKPIPNPAIHPNPALPPLKTPDSFRSSAAPLWSWRPDSQKTGIKM